MDGTDNGQSPLTLNKEKVLSGFTLGQEIEIEGGPFADFAVIVGSMEALLGIVGSMEALFGIGASVVEMVRQDMGHSALWDKYSVEFAPLLF